MNKNNTQKVAAGVAIGLAIAVVAGYYYGNKSKNEKNEQIDKPEEKK